MLVEEMEECVSPLEIGIVIPSGMEHLSLPALHPPRYLQQQPVQQIKGKSSDMSAYLGYATPWADLNFNRF